VLQINEHVLWHMITPRPIEPEIALLRRSNIGLSPGAIIGLFPGAIIGLFPGAIIGLFPGVITKLLHSSVYSRRPWTDYYMTEDTLPEMSSTFRCMWRCISAGKY